MLFLQQHFNKACDGHPDHFRSDRPVQSGFITELVILGLISRRDFTWINGEVEYYTLHTVRRTTYLYAVVDNNYCNVWANPFYGKGTEVWLLEVGSGMAKQKVMVSK